MVFFNNFWNIFFVLQWPRKTAKLFFLLKYWITESQKICKIVIRKFAIFSSGLIFKEKLFLMAPQFSTEQHTFITLEYTKKKGTKEYK